MEKNVISDETITKIKKAVETHDSIEFSCYSLSDEQRTTFINILQIFLDACDQGHLYNCLSYCLLELLDNANRANIKRIYFQENNLNINNETDYEEGMRLFKEAISSNTVHYFDNLEKKFLKIDLQLSFENIICIKVTNNTQITEFEFKRIKEKISKTKAYQSMSDAFGDIDQTEGSGLGIISIIFMLKRLGLDTDYLTFEKDDKSTIATIKVPLDTFVEI